MIGAKENLLRKAEVRPRIPQEAGWEGMVGFLTQTPAIDVQADFGPSVSWQVVGQNPSGETQRTTITAKTTVDVPPELAQAMMHLQVGHPRYPLPRAERNALGIPRQDRNDREVTRQALAADAAKKFLGHATEIEVRTGPTVTAVFTKEAGKAPDATLATQRAVIGMINSSEVDLPAVKEFNNRPVLGSKSPKVVYSY